MDDVRNEIDRLLSPSGKRSYEHLLRTVREACVRAQQALGSNVVSRVYGRDDKQYGDLFKSPLKIAAKVRAKRAREKAFAARDVRDVIGLTAVVQYPDQIQTFIDVVKGIVEPGGISAEKVERVQKPGYFATHVDFLSTRAEDAGLWCELQIKTMLHDAWSAKMHDLNYKPSGEIDPRLDSMMRVIANSLDAIESQSETLRDLITERWKIEHAWRRAARHQMFELMPAWLQSSGLDQSAFALRAELVEMRDELRSTAPKSDLLASFVARIAKLKQSSLRYGWPMAAYLGSLRDDEVHAAFALRSIEEWIVDWPRAATEAKVAGREIPEHELWSAPLACYATGDIELAIARSEELLNGLAGPLTEGTLCVLRVNLANFLIEREYFLPTRLGEDRELLRRRVDDLIAACSVLEAADPSPFHDLRGMALVTFGATTAEIQEGISLIERGRDEAPDHEKAVARAYYDLHARLAWRRLLEVENRMLPQ